MSSGDSKPQQSGGLGQSAPLVTIARNSHVSRGTAVPAGDDHPLATSSAFIEPPPPVAPAGVVATSSINYTTSTPPKPAQIPYVNAPVPAYDPRTPPGAGLSASITKAVHTPATPLPALSSTPQAAHVVPRTISPSKSLEAQADQFLSEPSYRTQTLRLAPILKPNPLPREGGVRRLRTLVERRAWGDVLKVSTAMLNASKEPYADVYASLVTLPLNAPQIDASALPLQTRLETVEIMTLQCHALLKLRRYDDLVAEVERWNFVVQNDFTATSPDWLPWSLHVLAAQAHQYTDDAERTSDVLFAIRDRIPKDQVLGLMNVDHALSNMFIRKGKWRLALGSLDRINGLIPAAVRFEMQCKYSSVSNPTELEHLLTTLYICEILMRQGKILLQTGALAQVATVFENARELWDGVASTSVPELVNHRLCRTIPCLMEMNEGLYYFAKSNYDRSFQSFEKALSLLRSSGNIESSFDIDDWIGKVSTGSETVAGLYSECCNNMALCHLYTCRMQDAVQVLESMVREDPAAFLNERIAFNLCTLYELGSDSAASARKKRVLQLIAKRFFLHDIGPESFRVT